MCRDAIIIDDIIHAARLAIEFTAGLDQQAFLSDLKSQSAAIHQLLVMGEAVKRLSLGYRESHPDVPWKLMAGMRDVLIHGYDIVDLDQVWQSLQIDLPEILGALER
jgi:uncharacterized protein with HEPN domain